MIARSAGGTREPGAKAELSAQPLKGPARQRGDGSGELELDQRCTHDVGGESAARGERVDVGGIMAEGGEHSGGISGRRCRRLCRGRVRWWNARAEFFEDILGRLHQLGAFPDQAVRTLGKRRVNGSGDGKDVAPLLGGKSRGDERAAGKRRFDDEHTAREPADHPVSAWKVRRKRRRTEGEFGKDAAVVRQMRLQITVCRRVNPIEPRSYDGDTAPEAAQATAVRAGVDPQCKPAYDRESSGGERGRERFGVLDALRRRVAASDNRKS